MSARPIPDRTRRLRFAGIVLWSSFLGAASQLFAWMAVLESMPAEETGFGIVSRVFFIGWGIALVPAVCAAALMTPRGGDDDGH